MLHHCAVPVYAKSFAFIKRLFYPSPGVRTRIGFEKYDEIVFQYSAFVTAMNRETCRTGNYFNIKRDIVLCTHI